jgi:hypothetical protein
MFWTGMRKGAVAHLGWDLLDQETAMLRLPPPGRKKRTTKAIPLPPGHPLRAILDRRWERRKERARATGRLEPLIFWRIYVAGHGLGCGPGTPSRCTSTASSLPPRRGRPGSPA